MSWSKPSLQQLQRSKCTLICFSEWIHEFVLHWYSWYSWSAFKCLENDSLFKSVIKKSPLMEVAFFASTRIEVGFDQGPSINGINFKIVCRCCRKNVFKVPDEDSKSIVSTFGTLEDTMLSLPIACYYHWLKSGMMFGTHTKNAAKFIRNRLLHPWSRYKKPDFDHISLCSTVQSKLKSHFRDD